MEAITREEKIISGENLTPITRKEMFLAKASGQDIQTPTPITREEYFLSKIKGGGGTVEGTAIPTSGTVDKIYFNTVLSVEETNAYLSQLTYVQTPLGEYPINVIALWVRNGYQTGLIASTIEGEYTISIAQINPSGNIAFVNLYLLDKDEESNNGYPLSEYKSASDGLAIQVGVNLFCAPAMELLDNFMGLPVGAENEKIKNVLSITPFTGTMPSNEPTAYTVSSVDELPSDAVDGSTAIVKLKPTYYVNFYTTLNIPQTFWGKEFSLNFIATSNTGINILCHTIYFWDDGSGFSFYDGFEEAYIIDDGWLINSRIYLLEYPNDVDLVAWLEESGGITQDDGLLTLRYLYIRENGEWVYKGEVA